MTTFVTLTVAERMRAAFPVLLAARKSVAAGVLPIDAIQEAGGAGLSCWFARQILLAVVPSVTLQAWQADPGVLKSDRRRVFDRAISVARKAFGPRGGWRVAPVGSAA